MARAEPFDPSPSSIVETLGGPDVAHVFAHDVSAAVASLEGFSYEPTLVARWAERALVMARPHDVVCVLEPVDNTFLSYLSRLGIGPRADHVVVAGHPSVSRSALPLAEGLTQNGEALERIRDLVQSARHVVVDPFMATPADLRLAKALAQALGRPVPVLGGGTPDVVAPVNRKDHVRAKALELGIPVASGEVVELWCGPSGRSLNTGPLEEALVRRVPSTGSALVRGACGASGSATFVVQAGREQMRAVLDAVAARTDNTVYLVDAMHNVHVSPNLLMYVEPAGGRITWVGASDQRLDADLVHRGNAHPSRARTLAAMVESAHRLARWLQREGFVGLAGFDFCEYRDPDSGRDEHFLAEINGRINGAAYPTFLLERINREQARHGRPPVCAFLSVQSLPTRARSFPEFAARHASSLFEPVAGRGCIPFNTGQLPLGRCSGVFFGPTGADVAEMHEAWLAEIEQA